MTTIHTKNSQHITTLLRVKHTVDQQYEQLRGDALAQAPVSAISGISSSDATVLGSSMGIKTIADLANHPAVLKAQAAVAAAAAASSPAQTAFYTELQSSVQTSLGPAIQGVFRPVNYPLGFPVATQGQVQNYYSENSLEALDALLAPDNDVLLQVQPQKYSNLFYQMIIQGFWKFSTADAEIMNSPSVGQAEQLVWAAVTQDGGIPITSSGTYPNGGWASLVSWVFTNFGVGLPQNNTGLSQAALSMSLAYPNTSRALSTYVNTQGPATALQVSQASALAELAAAQNNTKNPSAANGGLPTSASDYYVGYTVPPWATLTAGLLNTDNTVQVGMTASNFNATSTNVTIANSSYSVSPGWFSVKAKASASYANIETYTTASSEMTLSIVYPGVTTFGNAVVPRSTNNATGWYDNTILTQFLETWNSTTLTGFGIGQSTTYPPPTTLGTGNAFGFLKTWVISNPPTVSFKITNANVSAMSAAFQQGSAYANISLFSGSFGAQTSGYKVSSYQAVGSTVTVTLEATSVPLLPPTQQLAFVLGGVPSYPPPAP